MNWIVFAGLILLLMGFHHAPPLDDLTPVSRGRYVLGVFCLILLILLDPPGPHQLGRRYRRGGVLQDLTP